MPRNITQFDLLISCPSDVKEELEIIKETVEEFNRMFGAVNNCSIVTKHWSKDSYPQSGGKPQNLLNQQFVLDCDAAVAVFWTRFGTPTDNYGSGTEEEIEQLLKSGKQVFLYFCDRPIKPSSFESEQYEKVNEFKEKYKNKGIYFPYTELSDFKTKFLNHLTLHFIKLLSNNDTDNETEKSKLSIKGIDKEKISDNVVMFYKNYLDSNFLANKKDKIIEKFEEIKKMKLKREPVVKKVTSNSSDNDQLSKLTNLGNVGKVSLKSQEQKNGFYSIFSTSKVEISEDAISEVKRFAKINNIIINDEEFFYIGNLLKQDQPFRGGIFGGPTYSLVGSSEEKDKYNHILDLDYEITKYTQWEKFLKCLSSFSYLKLALCNFGTRFDEDIDIKVYIKSGYLCKKNQLPIPGDDILEEINEMELIDFLFKPKKSLSVIEYEDYPNVSHVELPFDIGGISYGEKIKSEKSVYKKTVESIFCYDYFQDNQFDVICFKQPYLKQNTNVLFPSILVFNSYVDTIHYEISSKHFSEVIKGQLKPELQN
jgi:hypothetical protein